MPEYTYRNDDEFGCDHCRAGFGVRQSIIAAPLPFCPRCGAAVSRRIVSFGVSTGFANRRPSDKRLRQAGFKVLRRNDRGDYDVT